MYILLFLLALSTRVSGDFEEYMFRKYNAANNIRRFLNDFEEFVKNGDDSLKYDFIYRNEFVYRQCDDSSLTRPYYSMKEALLKYGNLSLPIEVYDVHDVFDRKISLDDFAKLAEIDDEYFKEMDQSVLWVGVKWAGIYMHMKFLYVELQNFLRLFHVECIHRYYPVDHTDALRLAKKTTQELVNKDPVYAPGFVYTTCTNKKLTAQEFKELIPKMFSDKYIVYDAIYFKLMKLDRVIIWSTWVDYPKVKDTLTTDHYIQYPVMTLSNKKERLFEINWATYRITKGQDADCKEQRKWDSVAKNYFKEYQ